MFKRFISKCREPESSSPPPQKTFMADPLVAQATELMLTRENKTYGKIPAGDALAKKAFWGHFLTNLRAMKGSDQTYGLSEPAYPLAISLFKQIMDTDITGNPPTHKIFYACLTLADKYFSDGANVLDANAIYLYMFNLASRLPRTYHNTPALCSFRDIEVSVYRALDCQIKADGDMLPNDECTVTNDSVAPSPRFL